jgi:uncharacterized damage-inducible protein DinB
VVEDRWISYTIVGRFKDWKDPDFENFKDMESLRKYIQKVKENTEKYLSTLTEQEINREIRVPWGTNVNLSIETCLTHMVLEDMIHYGELSAALWQMGQEAPYMGFWRFKQQGNL